MAKLQATLDGEMAKKKKLEDTIELS
ncbi:hypothetical protein KIPB_015767, partial [Kipferlia bialata]|eukprot:g15767.t1